ncbi:MAG: hypothetical protein ACTS44_01260 [Candidatus Hodgkinia cicadicola]
MVYATTETSVGDLRKTDVTNWIGLREMNERMVFRKRSGAFREGATSPSKVTSRSREALAAPDDVMSSAGS